MAIDVAVALQFFYHKGCGFQIDFFSAAALADPVWKQRVVLILPLIESESQLWACMLLHAEAFSKSIISMGFLSAPQKAISERLIIW